MKWVLVALLAVIFSAPAVAQPAPPRPGRPPADPARSRVHDPGRGVLDASERGPRHTLPVFRLGGLVAGVVREWLWDTPPSR